MEQATEIPAMTYTYDELNRRTTETDADNTSRSVLYDENSNAVQTTLRDGLVILRAFDGRRKGEKKRWRRKGVGDRFCLFFGFV